MALVVAFAVVINPLAGLHPVPVQPKVLSKVTVPGRATVELPIAPGLRFDPADCIVKLMSLVEPAAIVNCPETIVERLLPRVVS